VAGPEYRASN